ncbi:MAG: hypothetical protein KF914_12595 [Rhizobiaceae bacterium]|nr:hypothetical protein [Rhizobiaceae bacterium]
MFFGVSGLQTFHVLVSLVGIVSGLVVLSGLIRSQRMSQLTALFLATTLTTTLTGFVFPFNGFTPAIGVGIISTIVMAICLYARYGRRMGGAWRGIYVITAVISLYLNVFVLVVQLFLKVPSLHGLAPNGSEPPFGIAQGVVLIFFLVTGFVAWRRFRPASGAIVGQPA